MGRFWIAGTSGSLGTHVSLTCTCLGGSCPPALTGSKQSAVPVLPHTVRGCCTAGKKHGSLPLGFSWRHQKHGHTPRPPWTPDPSGEVRVPGGLSFRLPQPQSSASSRRPWGPSLAPKFSLSRGSGRFLGKMANWLSSCPLVSPVLRGPGPGHADSGTGSPTRWLRAWPSWAPNALQPRTVSRAWVPGQAPHPP